MNNKDKNNSDKEVTTTKKPSEKKEESQEYETMSPQQNRHGEGRQQNGSDGGSKGGRGSNH
jgi:hypothetical protein